MKSLSIIIPTLNEAKYIKETLSVLYECKSDDIATEIILVDAGSTDDTIEIARPLVDQIWVDIELQGAKFLSLNKGAELACGEVLLFLDADCLLPNNFDTKISELLENDETVGGAFEFKMNGGGLIFKLVELINRIRYRMDHRYFGDQGLFCQKSIFEQVGGYPAEPIMEAAYFCRLLERKGALKLIKSPIISSVRRFNQGNTIQVIANDFWIWIQFVIGMDIKKYASNYWEENKKRGEI